MGSACPPLIKENSRTSLIAQILRICLPMQVTWVRSLVWEEPTCLGATKPVSHNYWSPCTPEPVLCNQRRRCKKPAHRNEEQPPLSATRGSLRTATKTQHSQQLINFLKENLSRTERSVHVHRPFHVSVHITMYLSCLHPQEPNLKVPTVSIHLSGWSNCLILQRSAVKVNTLHFWPHLPQNTPGWNFQGRINRWGGYDTQKLKTTQRTRLRFPDGRTCATPSTPAVGSQNMVSKEHRLACKGLLGVRSLNTPKGEVNSTHITSLKLFLYL